MFPLAQTGSPLPKWWTWRWTRTAGTNIYFKSVRTPRLVQCRLQPSPYLLLNSLLSWTPIFNFLVYWSHSTDVIPKIHARQLRPRYNKMAHCCECEVKLKQERVICSQKQYPPFVHYLGHSCIPELGSFFLFFCLSCSQVKGTLRLLLSILLHCRWSASLHTLSGMFSIRFFFSLFFDGIQNQAESGMLFFYYYSA